MMPLREQSNTKTITYKWGQILEGKMGYGRNFYSDFLKHTLMIVEEYSGEYAATLMVNCLLGLLVVPEQKLFDSLPEDSLETIERWGINRCSILSVGDSKRNKQVRSDTIKGLIVNLRHSIAHFTIFPIQKKGSVESFLFQNDSGFVAIISLDEMRCFVSHLSRYMIGPTG